jgi:hypothetical protein
VGGKRQRTQSTGEQPVEDPWLLRPKDTPGGAIIGPRFYPYEAPALPPRRMSARESGQ